MESELDDLASDPGDGTQNVFKQYFEARFEPLGDLALPTPSLEEESDAEISYEESEVSEWDGISDAETAVGAVEVIEHEHVSEAEDNIVDSTEVKTFMVSRCYR